VICFPTIEIKPVPDPTLLDRALSRLDCYDWLVLTSANAVEAVWGRLIALGITQLPSRLCVAAIGPKTADALKQRGIVPDFVPNEHVAEALLPGLGDLQGRWVLLPRADLAREALPEAISKAGGVAHVVVAYHTLPAKPERDGLQALEEGVDVITFTSSSTARNFVDLIRASGLDPLRLPGEPLIACIGPVTATTARQLGMKVSLVARDYTVQGLVNALLRYEDGNGNGAQ
jgi:uroporphyrinogen-III synthase